MEMRHAERGMRNDTLGVDSSRELTTAPRPGAAHSAFHIPHSALEKAVICRGVTKEFGDGDSKVQALRGVDLEVFTGQMTLLVGPSGCGKTTLISIVAGLLDPTEGEVEVLGQDLRQLKHSRLVNFRGKYIGFVFQQYNLLPSLTAAENAAVPLLIAGRPHREAVAQARSILEAVGMSDKVNALPSQLSGGQQQRVAIARALVHEPKLLVCDEPTAALDAHSGQTVMDLLKRVAVQSDRAVIVVTHDSRVFRFGDRIVYMSDGHIERVETPEERSRLARSDSENVTG
jgi:putative ABC transport system ATP-binding protein